MTASLSWLDHSEHERRKYLDVIDMFRESGTVDELGIGVIRDVFADALFPGTSTIQTRAGYFLFVPWIYREFERQKIPSTNIERAARNAEIRLIGALIEGGERNGVIGIEARKTLKRLPSNVYWNGLLNWGIRLYPGSQPQYHRSLDAFHASPRRTGRNEDGEAIEDTVRSNWHPHLPPAPPGFPKVASFALRRVDASYLRERIIARHPHTMLAFLVSDDVLRFPTAFPWEHPLAPQLPAEVADQLHHARCFAEALHGAALLYNLMLAQALPNEDQIAFYEGSLAEWGDLIEARMQALRSWDQARFWQHAEPAGHNVLRNGFIQRWFDLALQPGAAAAIKDSAAARKLIDEREVQLKGARSRLHNERALALWNGSSGADKLAYRWSMTQTILADIQQGLAPDA